MGRKKQPRPRHAGRIVESHDKAEGELEPESAPQDQQACGSGADDINTPFYVEVDRMPWVADKHLDISELVLTDLNVREGFSDFWVGEDFCTNLSYSLRFRLHNVTKHEGRIRLGHWPILSASSIHLEFIEKHDSVDVQKHTVILSASFDGPDEGVSGLVHLSNLKFLTLRPVLGVKLSEDISSLMVRVQILGSAFDASESLLDCTRQLWKKSMMSVMAWLRPEVMTSEARYAFIKSADMGSDLQMEMNGGADLPSQQPRFDVAGFYEAIKPSKKDEMLEDNIPDLLPKLRPYQRRAAYWMVQREKGASGSLGEWEASQFLSPLCMPVDFLNTCSRMFYNPFSGNVSLDLDCSSPHVFGGILADEMGLGKTVELLACIFAHRKLKSEGILLDDVLQVTEDQYVNLKRLKKERVECVCGAVTESPKYKGLWVQCDICDAWQHADCVGYSPAQRTSKPRKVDTGGACKSSPAKNLQKHTRKKNPNIIVMEGEHICLLCSELIQATHSPVATGATLIVCPATILKQWHSEIARHTKPGSLNICIYEGVKNTSLSAASGMDIDELVSADIVLTTYDILRDDLSHDSDRHEGDRRFMRFQKRYPVTPTPLTRISWWRICLDEAQMVESNAAAATEMALRLRTKHRWCITGTPIQRRLDDLYGLLKFLQTSPFDIRKWWKEIIRDPYEKRDAVAMEFTHKFFKQIMWRSLKIHVADELLLPPQEECLSWLIFSPIEEYFYQRQHESCVSYAREIIDSFKDDILKRRVPGCLSPEAPPDSFITQTEAAKLLNSLLKLRQACCHPQVGSSGLCSLQQSPMPMENILQILTHKSKIEGEEALRRLVVALNGLAAIAIINQKFSEAVSLYKEALAFVEEHSKDFSLDPLLNIHIHYNLAEVLPLTSVLSQHSASKEKQFPDGSVGKVLKKRNLEEYEEYSGKHAKLSREEGCSGLNTDSEELSQNLVNLPEYGSIDVKECDLGNHILSKSPCERCLRTACEDMKWKYLSAFSAKLTLAQQEFKKSYMQVCHVLSEGKKHHSVWWLEALDYAQQSEDSSSELIRKVADAVSRAINSSWSSRLPSRFRSIDALKYHMQTSLDRLEASRQTLVDRLLEIDQTMEKPREEDVGRVRYCPVSCGNGDGSKCVHCELDELFQVYEARLFCANKGSGGIINSAEEVVDLQRRKSALNCYYRDLLETNKKLESSGSKENKRKRGGGKGVVIKRNPSELEIVLGVLKSYSRGRLGRESVSAASSHLHLLEGMRKEYGHARTLASAQAQFLRAHDEIKMSTSRLHLRVDENEKSVDALCPEELVAASIDNSSDKLSSLRLLSQIKGQIRYLEGLVESKQKPKCHPSNLSLTKDTTTSLTSPPTDEKREFIVESYNEACPICQEKLRNQKMVFQCGHVTCCKCLFAMTERRLCNQERHWDKWLTCPTCRQQTEFENIAYADDGDFNLSRSALLHTIQGHEISEASITVQGSYGTKIEAITRRILWIKSMDPKAKILVFSSWNDVLDVLEHALSDNHISHIRMKGGRKSHVAISHFRGQKSSAEGANEMRDAKAKPEFVQVLLLLVQHGSNGLNLLEAQHVVLTEPLLNPAAEAQAISRVHRIGQENRTIVHRFMVKKTVEESIYKLNRSKNSCAFISGNTKNQDQPRLTLRDVESLFATMPPAVPENGNEEPTESLTHLPPSVAAAIAAERRLGSSKDEIFVHPED